MNDSWLLIAVLLVTIALVITALLPGTKDPVLLFFLPYFCTALGYHLRGAVNRVKNDQHESNPSDHS